MIVTFIFVPNIHGGKGGTTHFAKRSAHTLFEINQCQINLMKKDRTVYDLVVAAGRHHFFFLSFFFLLSPTRVHIKRNHSSPINFGARRDLRDKVVGPQL